MKNPVNGVTLPKPEPVERHPLSPDEVTRLLAAVEPFFKPFLYIAITTGLRWSELIGLQLQDVILDGPEPQLTVSRGLHITNSGLKYEKPKSSAGHRTVPLTTTQAKLIKSHIEATLDKRQGDASDVLFMTSQGHPVNYSNFRSRIFGPALKKAGITKTRFHDLRRTTATMLVEENTDFKSIEQLMGHSDVRLTLGLYASSRTNNLRKAIIHLDELLQS